MFNTFKDGGFDISGEARWLGHCCEAKILGTDCLCGLTKEQIDRLSEVDAIGDAAWKYDCSYEEAEAILRRQARLSVIQGPGDTIGRTECDDCQLPY